MPVAKLYAYLLEKKLVTPIFVKPKEGPPLLDFDPSKKCEHPFWGRKAHLGRMYAFETSNSRTYRQQASTVWQHGQTECHHQSLASLSGKEHERYLYSGGEDPRFLVYLIPLESYVMGSSPRKSHCFGKHRSPKIQLGSLLILWQ